ncbi:MAG: hypothetical protein IPK22_18740 [Verrucomicrobiaceae bacterium]|nr:hypothetical protein [Verrucomicrobiaceae bacterium]
MIARTILDARIAEVREALRKARLLRHMAWAFLIGLVVRGSFLLATWQGIKLPKQLDRWSMLGLIVLALIAYFKGRRNIWSDREIARLIEQKHPTLDSLLLTALEHEPQAHEPAGYLHERLVDHALARSATQNWPVTVADKPYRRALAAAWIAVLAFLATDIALRLNAPNHKSKIINHKSEAPATPTAFTATLTPGDVEVERNSRVIIEARFTGPVPADATLVTTDLDGTERDRQPMRLTVDGQVFGGMIAKADRHTRYHVEFAGEKSAPHTLTVFDYPALVRSDVIVTPPDYTKLPTKETKNTQKVTALEGAKIVWKIKVNKPLLPSTDAGTPARTGNPFDAAPLAKTSTTPSLQHSSTASPFEPHLTAAELFGEDKTVIPLTPSAEDPTLLEAVLTATTSQKYRLHLVDEADRGNKNPPWFTVTVQSNQLAKIEVVFPKRDIQVSSLQELPVEAKISDDLSVVKSGAVFSINGNEKEVAFTHAATEPRKKHDVRAELLLEKEGAQPRQLVSYYIWAEDTGPKGEVRRSMSDMFFAEVRHFEDIFREAEAPPPEPGQPKPKAQKLIELQKQVVNATWKLIREANGGRPMESLAPDAGVVHQSQGIAMEQTKEAMEEVEDAEVKKYLTEAWKSMKDATVPLGQAVEEKKRSPLNQALTFEQSALEWLHRAQSREHQVMRQNSPPMAGAPQEANKNQIMDLELKQKEQRYEEEKAASEEQTAEQQENLQVLNRLKELARRQEALAEKMKELQNQLAQAKSESEKQELENQLKRLQAEQEQLLRDLDDLKDRMEKPENAQQMAEAKDQLEKTREQVSDAVDQLKQEKLTDATNAATRAQRELEQMQEDFRQKTSKKFAEEMKQIRQQAQQAAEAQKKISENLENQKPADSDLSQSLQNQAQARQMAEQQENVEKLLNNMRQLSEQAEQSEPLLHKNLYDAVRKAQTNGLEENLQEARDQLRYGSAAEAKDAERKAANAIDELQKGVEKAAESVLGSESEALRVAKNELDKLIKEAEAQAAGQSGQKGQSGQESQEAPKPSDKTAENTNKPGQSPNGQGEPQNPKAAQNGAKPGEGQKPGEQDQGKGQGQEPQMAENIPQPGQGQAKGEAKDSPSPRPGEGQQPGTQRGEGRGEGQPQTANNTTDPSDRSDPSDPSQSGRGRPRSTPNNVPNGPTTDRDSDKDRTRPQISGGAVPESLFFDDSKEQPDNSVFTGAGYERWSDRLRNVEELLNNPELRNDAAKILDRARELRVNLKRSNEAPQVSFLNQRITAPLIELRDRVVEELSKKDSGKNLAPVDRDPVPAEFRDLVKRYYKELGAGK